MPTTRSFGTGGRFGPNKKLRSSRRRLMLRRRPLRLMTMPSTRDLRRRSSEPRLLRRRVKRPSRKSMKLRRKP